MKDLILIGAYCPDDERLEMLFNCVKSLQSVKNDFDILISSHTLIPEYISNKVDFVFYDKNNDIITDLEYLNQPWFSPYDGKVILSTYVTGISTYLSVYRILISGLGISKIYGYNKVHYIEYDSEFNDFHDLYDNSKLLDLYDSVLIKKEEKLYEKNIPWGMGFFMSFRLDTMNELFLNFDRERLLKILLESESKTNEKITQEILSEGDRKIFFKDYYDVVSRNNKYMLSDTSMKEDLNGWYVPYFHTETNKVNVIVWNKKYEYPISVRFIINDNRIIEINNINQYNWSIQEIGYIEDIKSIETIVNNKMKSRIIFDENNREKFKLTNYSKKA